MPSAGGKGDQPRKRPAKTVLFVQQTEPAGNEEIKSEGVDNGNKQGNGEPDPNGKENDDSDELIIIHGNEVPETTKAKFAEFKLGKFLAASPDLVCAGLRHIMRGEEEEGE
ncbi:hypothetical protein VTI74DRAFT_7233 [Chaetomium olivicolor]